MTDPIADMLTRIRNGLMAGQKEVLAPYSKIKFAIAQILEREKYLTKTELANDDKNKFIKIRLKYNNKKPAINSIKRISKVGCRVYANRNELPRVLNNFGIAIISTSKGLMTNKEARKLGLGGEVICEVY